MAELQRLLLVLREDPAVGDAGRSPQPGLVQLDDMVSKTRAAGLDVRVDVAEGLDLPPGLDLTAFRIVQEALTNALKHAGAPTEVVIGRRGHQVLVRVENGPPAAGAPLAQRHRGRATACSACVNASTSTAARSRHARGPTAASWWRPTSPCRRRRPSWTWSSDPRPGR